MVDSVHSAVADSESVQGRDDRELLELAAKAAGIEIEWGIIENGRVLEPNTRAFYRDKYGIRWNWKPLDNSDQALMIAVKSHMTVRCYMGSTCAQIGIPGQKNAYINETNHADPEAATRRAIVRAAAEIGAQS